jgi:beta-glucosidase
MTAVAARIAKLVADLTLDEKAALTAGVDMWTTAAVPRLGIPPVRVTDGPNGARGTVMGPAGPPPPACRRARRSGPRGARTRWPRWAR